MPARKLDPKAIQTAFNPPPSAPLIPANAPIDLPPQVSAEVANLSYVSDADTGITRRRAGRSGFAYYSPNGKLVDDPATLRRIRSLAIPPAWTDVWICADAAGHLQATGRDVRGRKQFRYHPRWREVREETKYHRIMQFARALPKLRRKLARDLARPGLHHDKVVALIVKMLETTLIRVGNDEYAKQNDSYGLTTMQDQHVKVRGEKIMFNFRGKSGVQRQLELTDKRLARLVKACQDLPGQRLFVYDCGDGRVCPVGSSDVNAYLQQAMGAPFTAKDFRTWAGTVLAALALRELAGFETKKEMKTKLVAAVEHVAGRLGNTPSVCRKCYIHPAILETYMEGSLLELLAAKAGALKGTGLRPEEELVLNFLQRRLNRARREAKKAA